MASGKYTFSDMLKTIAPDGTTATMINMLAQNNAIVDDLSWIEGNLPNGNESTIVTALPDVTIRQYNQGVSNSKATSGKVIDSTIQLATRSSVDVDVHKIAPNPKEARLIDARYRFEAMAQKAAQQIFYGVGGTEINGLHTRYAVKSGAANSDNILLGGGAGSDNSSIWLIRHEKGKCSGFYPKGSDMGLQHEDMGKVEDTDASSNKYTCYVDNWKWDMGFMLPSWWNAVRICNIDMSNLVAESSAANLPKLMMKAMDRMPSNSGDAVFYCNRTVMSMLRIQAFNLSGQNSGLTHEASVNQYGKNIMEARFFGVPVRIVDQILNTEATIS